MNKIRLMVTSMFGLEAVVKRELQDFGCKDFVAADGRIEFDAELKDIARLNTGLRVADRVLVKVGECPARRGRRGYFFRSELLSISRRTPGRGLNVISRGRFWGDVL